MCDPRPLRRAAILAALLAAALGAVLGAAPAPAGSPRAKPAAATPARDAAFLDAVTWGVTASGFADLRAQGRERWLRAQLHPSGAPVSTASVARGPVPVAPLPIAPLPAAALPAGPAAVGPAAAGPLPADVSAPPAPFAERIMALDAQARAANALPDPDARKAAQGAYQDALNAALRASVGATLTRAIAAPEGVRERLTWVWFNRFNVHAGKANLRAMVGDYVDAAIRPRALGRFRDLVAATLRHPAMLRYLDNADNAAGKPNENYARELMERHTMGADGGYTQADVEALARILTGVGVEFRPENPKVAPARAGDLVRDGLFLFNPNRHDYGDKVFLGRTIAGRGWPEVEEALDLLVHHPATARSVARNLALAFLGDAPPDALVADLAGVFARTDGDVAAVLDALFRAPAFEAALGTGFKDPMRYVLSAVRLAYDGRPVLNAAPVQGWLNRLGEGLFNRSTPDGYPLEAAAWNGSGQMTTRFEVARQIGSGPAGLFKPGPDAPDEPAFPLLQNALYFSTLAATLGAPTRAALARATSPQEWNALYLASPEFMR